ncbi:MAG: hypothetical protein FH749_12130 [Firmicutes bacterium]|nr:hypothetical protein [Bacillota bacterium]
MSNLRELWTILEITAYTADYESTQKHPDDPLYGITYSGTRAKEWHTVAAGPEIPIGTRIFIPELSHKPNGGVFVVEDRGGAISNAHLDIYVERLSEARRWGRQHLDVLIWLPIVKAKDIARAIERDRQARWKDRDALKKLFP